MMRHEQAEWYERNKEDQALRKELKRSQIATRPNFQQKYDEVLKEME